MSPDLLHISRTILGLIVAFFAVWTPGALVTLGAHSKNSKIQRITYLGYVVFALTILILSIVLPYELLPIRLVLGVGFIIALGGILFAAVKDRSRAEKMDAIFSSLRRSYERKVTTEDVNIPISRATSSPDGANDVQTE